MPYPFPLAPDMAKVGKTIFDLLNPKPLTSTPISDLVVNPQQLYSSKEVAKMWGVSYKTAERHMMRMKGTVNLAAPRAKKRLLRVRGADVLAYINQKAKS